MWRNILRDTCAPKVILYSTVRIVAHPAWKLRLQLYKLLRMRLLYPVFKQEQKNHKLFHLLFPLFQFLTLKGWQLHAKELTGLQWNYEKVSDDGGSREARVSERPQPRGSRGRQQRCSRCRSGLPRAAGKMLNPVCYHRLIIPYFTL